MKKDNRWVVLAELVPWDELDEIYARNLNYKTGRLSVNIWKVIGALIIKHKLSLNDRDTVLMISENMQCFCGLRSVQTELPFDASIADQYVTAPNDLKLVNRAREETERLVDALYQKGSFDPKPRTYRRNARKEYLSQVKKRNKSKQEIRVMLGKQLRYLRRNLSTIDKMLDKVEPRTGDRFPLNKRDQRIYWVVQHVFDQQMYMYQNKVHSCSDRIVNIYQPHVRPMVRGKDRANVEFGSKINISEVDGFVRCDHLGWDNYDEGADLRLQVEHFRQTYGCYPELLLGDRKHLTRENRRYLKEHGIRIVGKPLGRPPKEKLSGYKKYKTRKEQNMRNHVEGKFGQGKNGYGLNIIRARRQDTSESWISAILFVMNLTKLMKVAVRYGYFLAIFDWSYIRRISRSVDTKDQLSDLSARLAFT